MLSFEVNDSLLNIRHCGRCLSGYSAMRSRLEAITPVGGPHTFFNVDRNPCCKSIGSVPASRSSTRALRSGNTIRYDAAHRNVPIAFPGVAELAADHRVSVESREGQLAR